MTKTVFQCDYLYPGIIAPMMVKSDAGRQRESPDSEQGAIIMDTQLIIDRADTLDLATRLAVLTGESVPDAVTRALRVELERQERECDIKAEVARMMAAARLIRARIKGPVSSDTSDLYDENGFPA